LLISQRRFCRVYPTPHFSQKRLQVVENKRRE
jgi:hypothetical protein